MNLYIDKIDNYEEPRKQIEQKMDFTRHAPEMTMPESAFLCGLIRKHRPEKIIEVGVSGGGHQLSLCSACTTWESARSCIQWIFRKSIIRIPE